MKKFSLTCIRFLIVSCFCLILLLSICTSILLSSNKSTQWLTQWINKQSLGLKLDYDKGNLLDGIVLHQLQYSNEDINISITQLQVNIHYPCLLKAQFCLKQLSANTATINLNDHTDKKNAETINNETLLHISLPIPVVIQQLQLGTLNWGDTDQQQVKNIQLQAAMAKTQLQVSHLRAQYQTTTIQAETQISFDQNIPLSINAKLKDDSELKLNTQLTVAGDLKHLTLQAHNRGRWPIAIQASANNLLDNPSLHINIKSTDDLQLINPSAENAALAAATRSNISFQALYQDGHINIEALNIHNAVADVSLSGDMFIGDEKHQQWQIEGHIKALNLATLLQDKNVESDLNSAFSSTGSINDFDLNTLSGEFRLFNGTGLLAGNNINVAADFFHSSNLWLDVRHLSINSGKNQLSMQGQLSKDKPLVININITDTANFLTNSQGAINGEIQVFSNNESMPEDLNSYLLSLNSHGEISIAQFQYNHLSLNKTQINYAVNQLAKKHSHVTIMAKSIQLDSQKINNIDVSISGKQKSHRIKAKADWVDISHIEVDCKASLKNQSHWQSRCEKIAFTDVLYKLPSFRNAQPLLLDLGFGLPDNNDMFSIAPFCLQGEKKQKHYEICSLDTIKITERGIFDIDIQSDEIPIANIAQRIDPHLSLSGYATLSVKAQWPNDKNKQLKMEISSDNSQGIWHYALHDEDFDKDNRDLEAYPFSFDNIKLQVNLNDQQASLNASYHSKQLGQLNADINILDITKSKDLKGEINIQSLSLKPIARFSDDIQQSDGSIYGRLHLSGSLEKPLMQGQITLSDGLLLTPVVNNRIDNIQLNLIFDLHKASLSGSVDIDKSPLKTQGHLTWLDDNWQATLAFQGTDIPFNAPPLKHALISPDIQVFLQQDTLSLSGTVTMNDTLIEMKKLPESAFEESDDVVFHDQANTTNNIVNPQTSWTMKTDLTLILQDNISFRGFGADVDLSGNLHYQQQGSNLPIAQGEIVIDEGHYTFWGQRLDITEGSFIFTGPLENPDIKIEAVREIETENITVGIHGYGPLEEPTFDVFSSKAMDNQTAMHYLITGRAPDTKASDGSDLLSTALLARGVSGVQSRTGDFADKIGIRDFQMSTASGDTGTEVQLSGYIHDKIFIRYGMGLFDRNNTFTMRYQLMPQLFVETASGLDSTIDLIYSFEIKQ
ncbi:MAG: translocation/assembly module TamB domain-containing protein [Pseudomonadales bacterium]|nr:translocation/assembly module TamB domain-containing protein [Pseudomonadales bacterium]